MGDEKATSGAYGVRLVRRAPGISRAHLVLAADSYGSDHDFPVVVVRYGIRLRARDERAQDQIPELLVGGDHPMVIRGSRAGYADHGFTTQRM